MKLAHKIAHLLLPRDSNKHKAKILHSSYLVYLSLVLFSIQLLFTYLPKTGAQILGYAAQINTSEIISLTNQKRQEAGMLPLVYNSQLEQAARAKGEHMLANDYWAHVAPDGTEPWAFFANSGYKYRYAGENLAKDFSSANSTVDAWMASPSHRDNLLSPKYKEIGIAVVEGDLAGVEATIVVQLFGTQLVDTIPQVPVAEAKQEPVSTVAPTIAPTNVPTLQATIAPTDSPSPSPTTSFIAQLQDSPTGGMLQNIPETAAPIEDPSTFQVLISPFNTTRGISISLIVLLIIVMLIDASLVAKKHVRRISGRVVAHLAFLGMIMAIVLIAKAGEIL